MADPNEPRSRDNRRTFLARATVGIGAVIGAVTAIPLIRYLWYPVGRKTVKAADAPIDVLSAAALEEGAPPVKVQLRATSLRDAWTVEQNVPLGSAWVRKEQGKVVCFSAVCPHLGCAVDYDASSHEFRCPCHKSVFGLDGKKISGPAKRGLDPLPVEEEKGRVLVSWRRYKADVPDREEV